ncbi:protein of unknown function [Candidatus Methylocalor cossyra]|uniref:Uncharacterized protein n=1 Tax=Candidatus Methylocalor cossyra TaxID=3108543 RepID=A0ABM9NMJ7_9GAMM
MQRNVHPRLAHRASPIRPTPNPVLQPAALIQLFLLAPVRHLGRVLAPFYTPLAEFDGGVIVTHTKGGTWDPEVPAL